MKKCETQNCQIVSCCQTHFPWLSNEQNIKRHDKINFILSENE